MTHEEQHTQQPEEKQYTSLVHKILDTAHKPAHLQHVLQQARDQLILDRAYIQYSFSGTTPNEAIAASAYSLAQLHFIDLILSSGQVHEI